MKENKLIAEFEQLPTEVFKPNDILNYYHNGAWYEEHELSYEISWDWLMPVVEKINLLDDYRYTFLIASMDTQIVDNITNDVIVEVSCKHSVDELIKSVYEAVVEFIKQLNKES
tara:strand:- start:106 stop:447 length:342 start_codon:yes stop_codon:yes gene_type:complete